MSFETNSWFVIINPASGNGSSKKKWPKIESLLKQYNFNFEYAFTQYPKHSKELLKQAIKQNKIHIISVGGDGTLHNIVNGIMEQDFISSEKIKVGVIPIGTGNDWVKTHQIPKHIEHAIQLIKKGNTATQDLGKIEFLNNVKPPVYFNNLAGLGFDGYVVNKIYKHKRFGSIAYLTGALSGIFSYKNFHSQVYINSKTISGETLMILIGLCKFSGGGMQLTETPNPFDGLFDVSIAKNLSKLDVIKNLPKLFNGKIIGFKKVHSEKTVALKIEVHQENKPFNQADGELLDSGSIIVTLIPKAFSFYC